MQKQTKMLQFRRTFQNEQIQLQDLNTRLRQYLSRVKELENDNALLMKEINTIRQDKTVQWEKQYLPELRELRSVVNQLTLEKYKAEMDRENLGRELQAIQALCCEETVISRDIEGERKGSEKQLQQALKKNAVLEEHLRRLENEYMCLQDTHSQDMSHLRSEVHSRALPIVITQNYQGHPAVTMEEIEAYAQTMSESLNENVEVYFRRIEVLEDSIKANQANLEDLQREKTRYASELKKLHAEAHKQNKLQLHLEDQLIQLQDQFHLEADRYQAIIGELEDERGLVAHTIAQKLNEYQKLMQVKMGLSLEVANYRALLEGEIRDPIQKMDQYAREASRRIDIKMPSQPWSTTTRQEVQKQYPLSIGSEARYTNLASSLKASFGSTNIRSTSPARVIPISTHARDQRSAPVRRDVPSFTKPSEATTNVQKTTTVEERIVRTKEPLQKPVKDSISLRQSGFAARPSPEPAPTKDKTTVVTTSTESTVVMNGKRESKHDLRGHEAVKTEGKEEKDANKVTVKEWTTPDRENVRTSNIPKTSDVQIAAPEEAGSSERLPATMSVQKIIVEEQTERTQEVPQKPVKDSANQHQQGFTTRLSPEPAPVKDKTTVVMSSTENTATVDAKADGNHDLRGPEVVKTEVREEKWANNVTLKEWTTRDWDWEDVMTSNIPKLSEVQIAAPEEAGSSERLPATMSVQKIIVEEQTERTKEVRQKPVNDSANQHQQGFTTKLSPEPAPMKDKTTVVMSSTENTATVDAKVDGNHDLRGPEIVKTEVWEDKCANNVTLKEWTTRDWDWEDVMTSNIPKLSEVQIAAPEKAGSSERLPVTMSVQKIIVEEQTERTKEVPQKPVKDSANQHQQDFTTKLSPEPALMKDKTTVVMSSTESTATVVAKADGNHDLRGPEVVKTEVREEKCANNVTLKEWTTPDWEEVKISNFPKRSEVQSDTPEEAGSSETLPATTTVQNTIMEERIVRSKEPPQKPVKDSASEHQPVFVTSPSPEPALTKGKTTVFTTSMESTFVVNGKGESTCDLRGYKIDKTEGREENDANKVTLKEWTTPDWEDVRTSNIPERAELQIDDPEEVGSSDEQIVDYIYMEEILEKVMRPAGLDTKFINPSPDSKVAYRVEKTEDEDGKIKTQIILESRVEEDLDITDDSALQELLSKGVKKISLEDIKGTPTGIAIENLLSLGHHIGGSDLEHKSVNVEIIEEPAEDHGDEEGEANPAPTLFQPSSMFFQIEELDSDSHGAKLPGGKTEVSKPTPTEETEYRKEGSIWVREGYREADDPFFSHVQETEYFVSTPDDSISESEEERGISSYGHYGVLDDLSDERYYQEVPPINPRFEEVKGYKSGLRGSYMTTELGFAKDRFPECIIEEEVQVSPTMQESMLDLLTEDSMDPKQQLREDLDKLQGNVFESLQDEQSHVTKNVPAGPTKLSVDVKKVQEVSDNGTVTITAELRDLEDSDSLEDSESDKQVPTSSHPGLQHTTGSKTVQEYAVKIISDQDTEPLRVVPTAGLDVPGLEGLHGEESAIDIHKTERVIKLGPSERSLTFHMNIGDFASAASVPAEGGEQEFQGFFSQSLEAGGPSGREGVYTYVQKTTVSYDHADEPAHGHDQQGEAGKWDDLTKRQVEYGQVLQFLDPQLKVSQEKKIATLYLDSAKDN